jgi:glycosyltransferase involved in cell wall biosynthesis
VHVHDVRLVNLYWHGAARGAVPDGFEGALAAQYPELPAGSVVDGRLPDRAAEEGGILMLREVAHLADRILVTSDFAARRARLDLPCEDAAKLAVWPYAYPPPVDRPEAGVDNDLVCSFGLVNAAKNPTLILDAFALLAPHRPGLRLAFAGPASDEDRASIEARADELGVAGAVEVAGRLDDREYEAWLCRAGLAVQLRARSNGETSGAIADCLAHGVPTVVTALGPQADLGDFVAKVPAGATPADLAAVMAGLLDDPGRRRTLGEQARRHARTHGFEWSAATLFELIPELAAAAAGGRG